MAKKKNKYNDLLLSKGADSNEYGELPKIMVQWFEWEIQRFHLLVKGIQDILGRDGSVQSENKNGEK